MILRKTSSLAEHSMPVDSTPRTFACLISMPGAARPTSLRALSFREDIGRPAHD